MAISEYDAFGPWIYEIDDEHPVPRLFAPYLQTADETRMLFKIPRNIERRVATPDMDLYDYVVGAYDGGIRVWKREEGSVTETWLPFSGIQGLALQHHFLKGVLTFYTDRGTAALPFNAVSMDLIRRFTAWVRERTRPDGVPLPDPLRQTQPELAMDLLFTNLLHDLQAEGEAPLRWACQREAACQAARGGLRGIFRRSHSRKIPASLHVLTPRDLIVIRRDVTEGKHAKEEYSYHYFYFPLDNIRRIGLDQGECVAEITISLPDHALRCDMEPENTALRQFYDQVKRSLGHGT